MPAPDRHTEAQRAIARQVALRLGILIRRARVSQGRRQREVAARAGISRNLLSLIEHGRRMPSLMVMVGLTATLALRMTFVPAAAGGSQCGPPEELVTPVA